MLVLLSKLYLLINIIIKGELWQTVLITSSFGIDKTRAVYARVPMIHAFTCSRFTGIPIPKQGYTIYLVTCTSSTMEYFTYPNDLISDSNSYLINMARNRLCPIQ